MVQNVTLPLPPASPLPRYAGGRSLARKGRGATMNPAGRFERYTRQAFDDGWADLGWGQGGGTEFEPPPLRTTVAVDSARTVINPVTSPDVPFDRSINPYRGCEHGCVYCFARPSHAQFGLSAGLDFEARLFAKPDAAKLLDTELRAPRYQCRPIAMGTNTDPYQPIEREWRLTRGILEVLARFKHPLTIVTKSALVCRDIDILAPMAADNLVRVAVSVTTLDRELARRLEPRAAAPAKRLAAIRALAEAGIPVGVMVAPVIPAINDTEMEAILQAAREAGASIAAYIPLRLPNEVKDLFIDWLGVHAPQRKERALSLIRQMRGGKLNDANFGSRFVAQGAYGAMLRQRFYVATRKLGLAREAKPLDTGKFARPPAPGEQLSLL